MVALTEQKPIVDVAQSFIDRAKRVTNGVENLCDSTWSEYKSVLHKQTDNASRAMRNLVAELPAHHQSEKAKQGYIDFQSPVGRQKRLKFLKNMAKIYAAWQKSTLAHLDIQNWKPEVPSWEKSLGLHDHKGGHFLMRLRDEIVRKAHDIASIADMEKHVEEARGIAVLHGKVVASFRTRRIPVGNASMDFSGPTTQKRVSGMLVQRETGRALSRAAIGHGDGGKKIVRGVKTSVSDQEKSWLENVLRGIDGLARSHANDVYDVSSGTVLRDSLMDTVKKFSADEINDRQQLLAVTTHIRAMVRRVATSPEFRQAIPDINVYLQVPPTRIQDMAKIKPSVIDRAFEVATLPDIVRGAQGMGDSLGKFAGDQILPYPIPKKLEASIRDAAAKAKAEYLEAYRKAREENF